MESAAPDFDPLNPGYAFTPHSSQTCTTVCWAILPPLRFSIARQSTFAQSG